MIRRAADRLRIDPAKPKIGQIQFLNKDVDHPNGILGEGMDLKVRALSLIQKEAA